MKNYSLAGAGGALVLCASFNACSSNGVATLPAGSGTVLAGPSRRTAPAASLSEAAAAGYSYAAPWGGFGNPQQIFVLARGTCGDIPATQAPGYHWPAALQRLAAGRPVTIYGTPTFLNQWSIDNGCPTGGIVATNVAVGSPPTPSPVPLVPPPGQIYLGARVNPSPAIYPYQQSRVAPFEAQIGRTLALNDHYHTWREVFPAENEADDYAHNRIPVVAWNCAFSNASVAAGAHDADIVAAAAGVKRYGHLIFLRWFWEMDLASSANGRSACWDRATDRADGTFNPVYFVAAWKRIHAIFAAQQVKNVVWLWNPSSAHARDAASLAAYYPGDAQTDWVGFDSYALGAGEAFATTIGPMYAQLTALTGKPILIAESATLAANQPAWLANADTVLATSFPRVKGFMYFDAPGQRGDWSLSLTGNPSGLAAFGRFANSAYLRAVPVQR